MKKNITILMMALASLMACQKAEVLVQEKEPVLPAEEEVASYTLTVKAQKESDTKGLNLEGTALRTLWKSGEKVAVYKGNSYLGDLDVTPDAGNAGLATLSGSVTGSLAANDQLTLLFPHKTWDYTGQNGVLLQADGSIEKNYDYAKAEVTVTAISGDELVVDGNAHFLTEQSIYRISFTAGGSPLAVKNMTLSTKKGKLVRSMVLGGETTYGDLTVDMTGTSADLDGGLICIAVRNEDTTEQTYNFTVTDADGKAYIASKDIPAAAFSYKFLGIKDVPATQLKLPKKDMGNSIYLVAK